MRFVNTFLPLFLIALVVVMPLDAEMISMSAAAGLPIAGSTTPSVQANALQIRLADSGKAAVEADSSVKGYAIAVTDSSGMPVSDAVVAIRLPDEGATGFFVDGAHSAVAYTDAAGIAKFAQVNWGSTLGTVAIRVTATKGELRAGALIEQTILGSGGLAAVPSGDRVNVSIQATPAIAPAAIVPIAKATSPLPGTPASVASVRSGATAEEHAIGTTETAASADPVVSIVNTAGNKGGSHGSNKKWILLAVVAIGAGAGAAMALAGHGGGAAAASTAGIGIGTPTISVGH